MFSYIETLLKLLIGDAKIKWHFSTFAERRRVFRLLFADDRTDSAGSDALVEMMQDNTGNFEQYSKRIKDAEHVCDELTHKITTKLNKSFITPFDREDIYMLVVALDDVLDYIDAGATGGFNV